MNTAVPDLPPTDQNASTKIRAVLFDLDGTLIDRNTSIARFFAAQSERHLPAQAPAERRSAYVARLLDLDNGGYADKSAMYRQIATEFALPPESASAMEEDFRSNFAATVRTFPDTHDVLARLRSKGYRMGIITNGSLRMQNAKIRTAGLAAYMQTLVISEAEGIKKPAAEIFQRAVQRLGTMAAETIFIGDNFEIDVAGSKAAGLIPVWFASKAPRASCSEVSVRSLTGLETWLEATQLNASQALISTTRLHEEQRSSASRAQG